MKNIVLGGLLVLGILMMGAESANLFIQILVVFSGMACAAFAAMKFFQ